MSLSAKALIEQYQFSPDDLNRIVEMAWEDRTPFEAIFTQFSISEAEVIVLMRDQMKATSWRMWRERVQGRSTKHAGKRAEKTARFKSRMQKIISFNKMSKR
jgi:uncharacterized protein (TIGR03643 family)